MKLSDSAPEVIEKIKSYRWDRFIEKHEGPETWDSVLEYYGPEFMEINSYHVLLPVEQNRHPNVTILRCTPSADGQTLTIFLKDVTHVTNPADEKWYAGYVAICDKFPGEEFFITIFYHEWFIIEN
jgi:hypothetical protein